MSKTLAVPSLKTWNSKRNFKMRLHIKKTGDKTYLIDGNPYFISGLVCFIVTFLLGVIVRKGLDKAFLNAIGLTIIVTLIIYVFDQVGKKKYRKILSSKLFQYLLAAGFEVEEQSQYMGLIGEIPPPLVQVTLRLTLAPVINKKINYSIKHKSLINPFWLLV